MGPQVVMDDWGASQRSEAEETMREDFGPDRDPVFFPTLTPEFKKDRDLWNIAHQAKRAGNRAFREAFDGVLEEACRERGWCPYYIVAGEKPCGRDMLDTGWCKLHAGGKWTQT